MNTKREQILAKGDEMMAQIWEHVRAIQAIEKANAEFIANLKGTK